MSNGSPLFARVSVVRSRLESPEIRVVGEGRGAARWRRALGARTRQRVCAHRPVRAHVAVRIVSTRGMSERAGRRRATFSSRAWQRSFADFLEHEETKRGLSEFEPRLTHGARSPAMAPPARQDPIPGSYIRECVTKEGAHRWNVRAYDAATRATVTLGTFGNLAEAKGAYCCLLYTSPSPRDATLSRMPSSA